jgi:hypothetical protein
VIVKEINIVARSGEPLKAVGGQASGASNPFISPRESAVVLRRFSFSAADLALFKRQFE